jgi:hypothetical protein
MVSRQGAKKNKVIFYGLFSMVVALQASPFGKGGLRGIFVKPNLP